MTEARTASSASTSNGTAVSLSAVPMRPGIRASGHALLLCRPARFRGPSLLLFAAPGAPGELFVGGPTDQQPAQSAMAHRAEVLAPDPAHVIGRGGLLQLAFRFPQRVVVFVGRCHAYTSPTS